MIERIYIPTYRRVGKQLTYENLLSHWQEKAVLVVCHDEYDELSKDYECVVCPHQGKPPENAEDPTYYGLSPTRKWIAEHAGKIKYAVFDDDICEFVYTRRPSEPESHEFTNTVFSMKNMKEGYEHVFDEMMVTIDKWLDEFATVGLEVTWNPPFDDDYKECWRQTTNHFFNGALMPMNELDFTSLRCAQDYYLLLQLLTKGYKNRVSMRYRVRPDLTQAPGGCEEYRTLEVHNNAMIQLRDAFPEFVKLKEKVAKSGEWGGKPKLAANIQWKKAWKSSQEEKHATLQDLFG